jgi:hypothetical protein
MFGIQPFWSIAKEKYFRKKNRILFLLKIKKKRMIFLKVFLKWSIFYLYFGKIF